MHIIHGKIWYFKSYLCIISNIRQCFVKCSINIPYLTIAVTLEQTYFDSITTLDRELDADLGPRWDQCVVAAMDRFTWTTKSCGEKGTAGPLSQEESAWTLALTGFYCFSGHITSRWSSFTMHRFTLGGYRKQRRGCC